MKTLLIGFIFLFTCFTVYPQKMEVPIRWKTGDVWTYDLKKRESTRWTDLDERSRIGFQLKIIGLKPGKNNGYEAEWQYFSIEKQSASDEYDSCNKYIRSFLLQTPLRLSISKDGAFEGWTDLPSLSKILLNTQQGLNSQNKPGDFCYYMRDYIQRSQKDSTDFLSGYVPEVKYFFKAFMLLPTDSELTRDTVTVLENELAGKVPIPKKVNRYVKDAAAGFEVNFDSELSPSGYKKFLTTGFEKAWIEFGLPVEDLAKAQAKLDEFQPLWRESMRAVFDKQNAALKRFVFQRDERVSPMEDELVVYEFTRK